ncbi:Crp/Fnr family transcriptional regulator [Dehalogenimonas alkenigignens]|uniref:cAMP-binding protein n=1 Tax=Dehalogenimonas alkenigignens TaxID=1217799 RepID=A0A0W0GL94_9CHLR|nr:Crp/Fnr family transcriptional regulator [Dehalogenimonas alkenigignens]KTB49338.1 cAMP-binding protein [Dehalogenimonas alkenigignens]PVV83778.1 Crp/Fnr family transcriptional regulator [Dehalogenimonas alkenigignens]
MNVQAAEKLKAFFSQHRYLQYNKGELLLRAEDDPSGVYYLHEGVVDQYVISEKGDEFIVAFYEPVAVFPLAWAINGSPNIFFYEALTASGLFRAPKAEFLKFIENEPQVILALLRMEISHTDELLSRTVYLTEGSVHSKLITVLLTGVKRFGKKTGANSATLEFKITETKLASTIGTTPETISRELKLLKESGLIQFNKNILTINDIAKLEKERS